MFPLVEKYLAKYFTSHRQFCEVETTICVFGIIQHSNPTTYHNHRRKIQSIVYFRQVDFDFSFSTIGTMPRRVSDKFSVLTLPFIKYMSTSLLVFSLHLNGLVSLFEYTCFSLYFSVQEITLLIKTPLDLRKTFYLVPFFPNSIFD